MGLIDSIRSVSRALPEIETPVRPPTSKERVFWTGIVLLIFFAMYNIHAVGAKHSSGGMDFLQMITASRIGSLLTISIGPIVLASIFLQLFSGAGLLPLDPKDPKDKVAFQEVQRILAIVLAFVEAAFFVYGGRIPFADSIDASLAAPLILIQIAIGSVIVLYLDELVTKYGIGSGISLFIAAGVSFSILAGTFGLIFGETGLLATVTGGGAEAIPSAILVLMPLLFTILVIIAVAYGEGMRVEIPLTYMGARGITSKLPLPLFYLSNIPVIFASALLMNIQLFAPALSGLELNVGGTNVVQYFAAVDSVGRVYDGLLYLFTPIYSFGTPITSVIERLLTVSTPVLGIPEWVHAITFILFLAIVSMVFGVFWAETSGMDTKGLVQQIMNSKMQIPGWRRDPRSIERILDKYITPLILAGSFLVGLLAGIADLTGALGTGTGILLTVGIFHRTFQQMEQQKIISAVPILNKLFK